MRKNINNKGFTLMEMLIVVAIIAILVAIAIPVATKQIEKSREVTDLANARSIATEIINESIMNDAEPGNGISVSNGPSGTVYSKSFDLVQKAQDWQMDKPISIAGVTFTGAEIPGHWEGAPEKGGTCTVSYSDQTGIKFDWSGEPVSSETAINYNSTQSVGKYVYSQINKALAAHIKSGDSDLSELFNKKSDTSQTVSIKLPNGEEVSAIVYSRNYDKFQYITDRFKTENTASLIYNRDTKKLTTIVYYNDGKYSAWSYNDDYDAWESDDKWLDNSY